MMKPFVLLQLRPEDEAATGEFDAFLRSGGLKPEELHRIRMEKNGIPELDLNQYAGVLVGGGPYNVSDDEAIKPIEQKRFEAQLTPLLKEIVASDFPYLGACYGLGALAVALGGTVSKKRYSEAVAATDLNLTPEAADDPLLQGVSGGFKAFLGHKEACQAVPPIAINLASSQNCLVEMIRVKRNVYATQFHPEADPEAWAMRIYYYREAGYFPPEQAEELMAEARNEPVTVPPLIVKRFVDRYRSAG